MITLLGGDFRLVGWWYEFLSNDGSFLHYFLISSSYYLTLTHTKVNNNGRLLLLHRKRFPSSLLHSDLKSVYCILYIVED